MCNRAQDAVGRLFAGIRRSNGLLLQVSSDNKQIVISRISSTDLCNSDLIFRSNFTVPPIVECKTVKLQQYIASACNTCVRRISYVSFELETWFSVILQFKYMGEDSSRNLREDARCSSDFEIIINNEKEANILGALTQNFFSNSCYNISFHAQQYDVFCRCSQVGNKKNLIVTEISEKLQHSWVRCSAVSDLWTYSNLLYEWVR